MAQTTFNIPLDYINEYLSGESKRLQQPLDDALVQCKEDAAAQGTNQYMTMNIVPQGAINPGATTTVVWSQETCREYLYPPGDSARLQSQINNALTVMGRSANTNFTITTVLIQVAPN